MSPAFVWFVLGLVFFVAEMLTPAMVLLFFGIGSWTAALFALAGMGVDIQMTAFVLATLASLLGLRQRLGNIFGGKSSSGNPDNECVPHPLTGQRGVVSKKVDANVSGEVNVGGSFWRAVSAGKLPAGTNIVVLGADPHNALLLVVASV